MRSKNQRFHDRVAGRYDATYDDDPYHDLLRELSLRHVKRFLPRDAGARILDAGCGTGWFGARLARSGYAVDFLDLSAGMLDRARERYAALRLDREPLFVQGDLEHVRERAPGPYALVIAQGDILSFVEHADRTLRAVRSILSPGGAFFASVDQRYAGIAHFLDKRDVDGLADFLRHGRTVWLGGREDERFPTRMFTAEELRALLGACGFEVASLIGRPALPLRRYRQLLEQPELRRRLLALEESLHAEPSALGLASHLEFVARVPAA